LIVWETVDSIRVAVCVLWGVDCSTSIIPHSKTVEVYLKGVQNPLRLSGYVTSIAFEEICADA
jgi:hypothetical protein